MDINEAIQHCLDVAEQQEQLANGKWIGEEGEKQQQECTECAADHKELAGWLMELKDLRGAQNDQYVFIHELMNEIKVLKDVIRRIYTETTTDHYGDSLIALENIDKILNETRSCWNEV